MKNLFKNLTILGSLLVISLVAKPSIAQPNSTKGTDASYIGAGLSAGITNGGQNGDAATLGGNIQGRYAINNTPISVRGAILFTDENAALIPTISYDVAIANRVNGYLGLGYSFVEDNGNPTPLGNRDSIVLTLGTEAEMGSNVMLYGDAKWGIHSYENSPASAVSLQAGVGYKF
jgi:hypothetical protein